MTSLFQSGHTACSGCGQSLAARLVLEATGRDVIIANATGCLEVFTTRSPQSAWSVPWIHSLFENPSAVATGIKTALIALGRDKEAMVIAQGGDGATADIGLGLVSGMFERGDDVLYICYDNEAYMNTGVQRSGLTPFLAKTMTSPPGKASLGNLKPKKDVAGIAMAHHIPYAAVASIAYPKFLKDCVKKAVSVSGPKYIQIYVPCPLGWGYPPELTIEIAKKATQSYLYPVFEAENGRIIKTMKPKKIPVEECLKLQARFKHLFTKEGPKKEVKSIQAIADENHKTIMGD
jgi:pyruvate ferredoxin oxidoreductase beta subunit